LRLFIEEFVRLEVRHQTREAKKGTSEIPNVSEGLLSTLKEMVFIIRIGAEVKKKGNIILMGGHGTKGVKQILHRKRNF